MHQDAKDRQNAQDDRDEIDAQNRQDAQNLEDEQDGKGESKRIMKQENKSYSHVWLPNLIKKFLLKFTGWRRWTIQPRCIKKRR